MNGEDSTSGNLQAGRYVNQRSEVVIELTLALFRPSEHFSAWIQPYRSKLYVQHASSAGAAHPPVQETQVAVGCVVLINFRILLRE